MEISASENCINKNDETQNMFYYCLKVCTKVPANLNMIAYKDFYLLMHDFDIHTKHDLQFDLIRHLIWHWASLTYVIVCLYSICICLPLIKGKRRKISCTEKFFAFKKTF